MKKFLYLVAVAALTLTSCSNDESNDGGADLAVKQFTASIQGAAESRTSVNPVGTEWIQSWNSGDQVCIIGKNNKPVIFTAKTSGTSDIILTSSEGIEPAAASEYKFRAFYPASLHPNAVNQNLLPETYAWKDGEFNMPMHSKDYEGNLELSFVNFCGVIAFNVASTGQSYTFDKIVIKANKQLYGKFSIGAKPNYKFSWNDADATKNTIAITIEGGITIDGMNGKRFFAPIAPGDGYSLNIKFMNGQTVVAERTTNSVSIVKNVMYPLAVDLDSSVWAPQP